MTSGIIGHHSDREMFCALSKSVPPHTRIHTPPVYAEHKAISTFSVTQTKRRTLICAADCVCFVSSVTIFSLNVPGFYLDTIINDFGMSLSDFMVISMGNDLVDNVIYR